MSNLPRNRPWLRYLGLSALVLVIVAIGVGGWMVYDGALTSLRAEENLHATLFSIRLVEQFVHDKGRWPASWEELEGLQFPSHAPLPLNGEISVVRIGGQHGYEWPGQAEHLKGCVVIEFQIDQEFVASQDPMEFTAIKPVGPYYEYRLATASVQSLQRTLKLAGEAGGEDTGDAGKAKDVTAELARTKHAVVASDSSLPTDESHRGPFWDAMRTAGFRRLATD